jgi:hypothetical protein
MISTPENNLEAIKSRDHETPKDEAQAKCRAKACEIAQLGRCSH